MIDIDHDPREGKHYVRLTETKPSKTQELPSAGGVVLVDYDTDGMVVGVEFLV